MKQNIFTLKYDQISPKKTNLDKKTYQIISNMINLTKLDQILEILDQTYLNIDKTKPNVNKNQIPPDERQ